MKNTKRIRSNSITKTKILKSEIPIDFRVPPGMEENPLCLCLYDRKTQKPVSKIPIPEADFIGLRCNISLDNAKLASFIAESVLKNEERFKPRPSNSTPKYVLSLIEWGGGKDIRYGEIDVTALEFEKLQNRAKQTDDPCFDRALKDALEMMMDMDPFDLEAATYQSNALLSLMAHGLDHSKNSEGSNFLPNSDTEFADYFTAGLQNLIWNTRAG